MPKKQDSRYSSRQNSRYSRDKRYDEEPEILADDQFEVEFPDEDDLNERAFRNELTEEELFMLRRKQRRERQEAQRKAAKKREILFVSVFIAVFAAAALGIFLIVHSVKNNKKPEGTDAEAVSQGTEKIDPSNDASESAEEIPMTEKESEEMTSQSGDSDESVYDNPDAQVTDAARQTEDPLKSTDENGNWIPPYPTDITVPSWITADYIDIHPKTRPGRALTSVDNIVVHYVGNPGTSAKANRDYFNDIQYHDDERGASAHFVVGFDGEIIQCVPLGEMAQANYPRNDYTISIETCHPDETGKFTETTYRTLIKLVSWLCEEYGLTENEVIRHYDVSGKYCPIYYCPNTPDNPYGHPEEWDQFRAEIKYYMNKFPNISETDP